MRANWIWMTHNGTGGAAALTLAGIAGWPSFANVFTTTHRVDYSILEFTDASLATLKQAEAGFGTYNPTTGVLTRDIVAASWDGTTMAPREGSASAAAAITVGAVAANVRVTCAPTPDILPALPNLAAGVNGSDNAGTLPLNFNAATVGSYTLTSGTVEIVPILLAHRGPFSQITLNVGGGSGTYTGGTQSLTAAIYEIGADGLPGKKLIDFGAIGGTTPFASAANVANAPLATPVPLEPGWYYLAILPQFTGGTGTPRMKAAAGLGPSPLGSRLTSGVTIASEAQVAGQTALTDPATNTGLAVSNNGNVWAAALK